MNQLSTLLLLVAIICFSSIDVSAQQEANKLRRALKQDKVEVCKLKGNGDYQLIEVAEPAVQTHLDNGGVLAYSYYPDGDDSQDPCEPACPPYEGNCLPAGSGGDDGTDAPAKDDATDAPTNGGSTEAPTGEDTTMTPSEEASTDTPTKAATLAPTEGPKITAAPTEAATEVVTEPPVVVKDIQTQGPTEEATYDETLAPTDTMTDPPVDFECEDNPETRQVFISLQLGKDANDFDCTGPQEADIAKVIRKALNEAFPQVVLGWDGDFRMGEISFDDTELFDEVNPTARLRRRILEAARSLSVGRRAGEAKTCPARLGSIGCDGYCMWGCGAALTTNCGTYDSTEDWSLMQSFAVAKLIELMKDEDYACMGDPEGLKVEVTLQHGEDEDTRSFPVDAPTPTPYADEGIEIPVTTSLEFQYFNGYGGELDVTDDIAKQFLEVFNQFEETVLGESALAQYFNGMAEGSLSASWEPSTNTLTLHFHSLVYVLDHSNSETDHDVAKIMVTGDFHEFLNKLRHHVCEHRHSQSECNQFMTAIHSVVFQATGTGRRVLHLDW